jgi:hypothetical protein
VWLGVENKEKKEKKKEGRIVHRKENGFSKAWVEVWLE